ncbi:hypothetical protein FGB62_96g07 [Gracilaria domingensis]|nr:hypothetical protein FGB62_96g07 [Gracilaria domingensis]
MGAGCSTLAKICGTFFDGEQRSAARVSSVGTGGCNRRHFEDRIGYHVGCYSTNATAIEFFKLGSDSVQQLGRPDQRFGARDSRNSALSSLIQREGLVLAIFNSDEIAGLDDDLLVLLAHHHASTTIAISLKIACAHALIKSHLTGWLRRRLTLARVRRPSSLSQHTGAYSFGQEQASGVGGGGGGGGGGGVGVDTGTAVQPPAETTCPPGRQRHRHSLGMVPRPSSLSQHTGAYSFGQTQSCGADSQTPG